MRLLILCFLFVSFLNVRNVQAQNHTSGHSLESIGIGHDSVLSDSCFEPILRYPIPIADFCASPAYPDSALSAGVKGKVVIKVFINSKGNVKRWMLLSERPKGWGFGDAVEKVIPSWQFTPAIKDSLPTGAWIAIPFNFPPRSKPR